MAPTPVRDRRDNADAPPEDTFWKTYSPNLELPIASLLSVFAHVALVAGLVLVLVVAMGGGKDKSSVPITMIEGGLDDSGAGSPGSGGVADPIALGEMAPQQRDVAALPLPDNLPEVKDDIQNKIALEDPTAAIKLPDEKAYAYAALDESIRNKLLQIGQKRGSGTGAGSGNTGQPGDGPGGYGADSTRARGLRWVIRFRTTDGRNYLDQLQALGALVVAPCPPDFKRQMFIFRDLANPQPGTTMNPSDWDALANQIRFCDFKQESASQVSAALKLPYTAPFFWAFFPKGLEADLARLETSYQNKRAEDIEETVFQAVARGGTYQLVVARQTLKR